MARRVIHLSTKLEMLTRVEVVNHALDEFGFGLGLRARRESQPSLGRFLQLVLKEGCGIRYEWR